MISPESLTKLIIGIIGSFFGAFIGSIFSQRRERRDSYRRILEPYAAQLGNHCYQSVAISKTLNERIKDSKDKKSWLDKYKNNVVELEKFRLLVRYPLWGCDDGIRCLIRLPNWICSCYKNQEVCLQLLKIGDNIRTCIDTAVMYSLKSGSTPKYIHRWKIKYYAKKIYKIYNKYMSEKI